MVAHEENEKREGGVRYLCCVKIILYFLKQQKGSESQIKSSERTEKGSERAEKGSERTEKGSERAEKSSERMLELMRKKPTITSAEIAMTLDISSRAVEKNISKLKEKGRLKREGSRFSGRWVVIDRK